LAAGRLAFSRSRFAVAVLALTVLLTIAAVCLRLWSGTPAVTLVDSAPLAAASLIGTYVLTRSWKLALLAAALPAAVVNLTCAALIPFDLIAFPDITPDIYVADIVDNTIEVAALLASAIAMLQCAIALRATSVGAALVPAVLKASVGPGLLTLLAWLVSRAMPLVRSLRFETAGGVSSNDIMAVQAAMGAVIAGILCFAVFPMALSLIAADEASIARANRAGERVQRLLAPLEFLLAPRWALSATGIAAVLFALVFFDSARVFGGHVGFAMLWIWRTSGLVFLATVAMVFIGSLVWLRSWRMALAGTAAAAIAASAACWLAFRTGLVPPLDQGFGDYVTLRAPEMLAPATALFAGLAFLLAGAMDDDIEAALAVRGDAILCIALMALLACLPTPSLFFPLFAVLAALVLMPVFIVALQALVPRYRSVEEIFGRR
jgi:hypothetical protein